ncbi:pH-response regulator protein palC [Verticillium alfalfae VaMs.102]|uniref:pH-response regulator protein palC n=1 Tax=Verticillium alfalfae (strain VaMs.102 / ATCC MYA-4576 / FGSC 10136) TaxID=526221 RepID=C9SI44_VERA1|nr:pH-response regulator protein palC [Verticillium alfalfae VaMs.102]EEY18617.1 pH-response regulator protein palC [Verticillium alfalfae VaMs.102]
MSRVGAGGAQSGINISRPRHQIPPTRATSFLETLRSSGSSVLWFFDSMPFPFVLPTTSSFSFSTSFSCESHPSLPLTASTYRGVVRDGLKKHKRLPPSAQSPHISSLITALNAYLPYLFAIDAGLTRKGPHAAEITVSQTAPLAIEWRPTLSDSHVPGREPPRVKVQSLDHEVAFVLATLAHAYTLAGRIALQPLYVISVAAPSAQERTVAIQTATKHLLEAASLYDHVATRAEGSSSPAPSVDISPPVLRGLASQAHAEATLLAVLKDDPYPAVVSQTRNEADKEWMYRTPSLPKMEETRVIEHLEVKWTKINDLVSFFLLFFLPDASPPPLLSRVVLRNPKDLTTPESVSQPSRQVTTQAIPTTGSVLAQMPSGREIHTIKPFQPAELDRSVLEATRAPPRPQR